MWYENEHRRTATTCLKNRNSAWIFYNVLLVVNIKIEFVSMKHMSIYHETSGIFSNVVYVGNKITQE